MTDLIKKENYIIADIRLLIDQSKLNISKTINSQMTILYWHIGKRIRKEIIGSERAEYGEQIVKNLAKILTAEYGKGFSQANYLICCIFIASFLIQRFYKHCL